MLQNKLDHLELFYGQPMSVISDCIRGFLIPKEGHEFIGADFSSIEARVLAWLAGEEKVLEVFRGDGKLYEHTAAGIYRVDPSAITKAQRQIGKIATLALGYGGGVGAFKRMASAYGLEVRDSEAEKIKRAWRESNPSIVWWWKILEDCAMHAVESQLMVVAGGSVLPRIIFKRTPGALTVRLPSGRKLWYMSPKVEWVETEWGSQEAFTYWSRNPVSRKWEKSSMYGGKWAENIVQAVARDLLVEAMKKCSTCNMPIVIHVHDEIVVEVPIGKFEVQDLINCMLKLPDWAEGLPMAAEGWKGRRF